MRTTIELPDLLFREAKALAAQRGITLKALFRDALKTALKEDAAAPRRMERPPIPAGQTRRIPARSNSELASILDEDDSLKSR